MVFFNIVNVLIYVSGEFVVYLSCEIGYYNIVGVLQKISAVKGLTLKVLFLLATHIYNMQLYTLSSIIVM